VWRLHRVVEKWESEEVEQMVQLSKRIRSYLNSKRGASMVEYGLLVAFIALIVMVGAKFLGTQASALFIKAGGNLK